MNSSDQFIDIWGSGDYAIVIAGYLYETSLLSGQGVLLHYDGSSWSREAAGAEDPLLNNWGDGAGNVYGAGDDGTILRRIVQE